MNITIKIILFSFLYSCLPQTSIEAQKIIDDEEDKVADFVTPNSGNPGGSNEKNKPVENPLWQLAQDHFNKSYINLEIITPRPDSERTNGNRYSSAYPGLRFEVPIIVLGGSYPFKYEIISRTGTANVSTATIGETRTYGVGREWIGSTNQKKYGTLNWTPEGSAGSGDDNKTYSFTVKVTDQEGSSSTVTFSGSVDSSRFVFVDNEAQGSSDQGTINNPYLDTDRLWNSTGTDARHQGMLVYINGPNDSVNSSRYTAFSSSFLKPIYPKVFMKYPQARNRPRFDGYAKDYLFDNNYHDFFWSGIQVEGTPSDKVPNVRFFESGNSVVLDRMTWWDNIFLDGKVGTVGNDNNGWILAMAQGNYKHHWAIVNNKFDTANYSPNGFVVFDFYDVKKFVIENNIVRNFKFSPLWAKHTVSDFSIRSNDLWDPTNTGTILIGASAANSSLTMKNHEICYNWVNTAEGNALSFGTKHSYVDGIFMYRNTFVTTFHRAAIGISSNLTGIVPAFSENLHIQKNALLSRFTHLNVRPTERIEGGWLYNDDIGALNLFPNGSFDNWHMKLDENMNNNHLNLDTGKFNADKEELNSIIGIYGAEIK